MISPRAKLSPETTASDAQLAPGRVARAHFSERSAQRRGGRLSSQWLRRKDRQTLLLQHPCAIAVAASAVPLEKWPTWKSARPRMLIADSSARSTVTPRHGLTSPSTDCSVDDLLERHAGLSCPLLEQRGEIVDERQSRTHMDALHTIYDDVRASPWRRTSSRPTLDATQFGFGAMPPGASRNLNMGTLLGNPRTEFSTPFHRASARCPRYGYKRGCGRWPSHPARPPAARY